MESMIQAVQSALRCYSKFALIRLSTVMGSASLHCPDPWLMATVCSLLTH